MFSLVLVAVVVAALMLRPLAHANPTKLMLGKEVG